MLHISIIQEQLLGILSMDNAERQLIKEQSLKKWSCATGHIYKYNDKLTSEISYSWYWLLIKRFSQLLLWTTVWSLNKLGWYECTNGKNESKFGRERVEGKVRETIKFRFHLNICQTVESKLASFTDREREWSWMYENKGM